MKSYLHLATSLSIRCIPPRLGLTCVPALCAVPYGQNSIVVSRSDSFPKYIPRSQHVFQGKPSSRVLAAPGGGSSIQIGGDIDSSTTNQDKSHDAAMNFLATLDAKMKSEGRIAVGDMSMLQSFPSFECVCEQDLRYTICSELFLEVSSLLLQHASVLSYQYLFHP
jgi:hypothetical protein